MKAPAAASGALLGPGEPVLAFDVGGTNTKCTLVDQSGATRAIVRVATPLRGDQTGEAVVASVAEVARHFAEFYPDVHPRAAGLVVPGHVDEEAGIGIFSENLGWTNFPLRAHAEVALGMPVAFGHDVRAAGWAEFRLGAAAPFSDVVVMVIGTGISDAIFLQGRLYSAGGMAGEIGHSKVADKPLCICGGHGCLEAVASAGAIARRYSDATGETVTGANAVLERATAGDPKAAEVWNSALDVLALELAHTISLLAPEAIVLGGGLAQAGEAFFEPLERRLDALLTIHRRPKLLPASLGEDAGVIGAALMARDLLDARLKVARAAVRATS